MPAVTDRADRFPPYPPTPDPFAVGEDPVEPVAPVAPADEQGEAPATEPAGAAAVEPAAAPAGSTLDGVEGSFDRVRVTRLLERLERDVAVTEAAMSHVESGDHASVAVALASLEGEPAGS